jgi:hypothetical protein
MDGISHDVRILKRPARFGYRIGRTERLGPMLRFAMEMKLREPRYWFSSGRSLAARGSGKVSQKAQTSASS